MTFLLMCMICIVTGEIQLRGKGASFPRIVYKSWMAAYKRYRFDYISLNLEYVSVGSWRGKDAIKTNDDIEYAGSDSLLSTSDAKHFPDLITFPTMAG